MKFVVGAAARRGPEHGVRKPLVDIERRQRFERRGLVQVVGLITGLGRLLTELSVRENAELRRCRRRVETGGDPLCGFLLCRDSGEEVRSVVPQHAVSAILLSDAVVVVDPSRIRPIAVADEVRMIEGDR